MYELPATAAVSLSNLELTTSNSTNTFSTDTSTVSVSDNLLATTFVSSILMTLGQSFTTISPVPTTMEPSHYTTPNSTDGDRHFCKWVLYGEVTFSRVRIWDLSILIPNVIFLLVLAARFNRARLRLRATSSPIFVFYALVILNGVISVVRCIVSMTVNAAIYAGDITDRILWVAVRFFLLFTELSVVIFGLAFGHLDSKTSIRRVLMCTSFISLAYSITQGALEFMSKDDNFCIHEKDYYIFAHGGMIFWLANSIVFTILYIIIFLLPWTRLRERLALPSKRSFYYYVLFLAILNLVQAIGSGLFYYHYISGLCTVDVTTYIYFTLFTPLVYKTFLSDFFGITQPSIMFSYKAQVDETVEDDTVSLPHQLSCSSLKTDSDYIYQNNSLYDSTQFEVPTPVNPLYAHSLQSPDSITGYNMSRSNSINSDPGYQQVLGPSVRPLQPLPPPPPPPTTTSK